MCCDGNRLGAESNHNDLERSIGAILAASTPWLVQGSSSQFHGLSKVTVAARRVLGNLMVVDGMNRWRGPALAFASCVEVYVVTFPYLVGT